MSVASCLPTLISYLPSIYIVVTFDVACMFLSFMKDNFVKPIWSTSKDTTCLQTCNVAASEEIVGERCVPSIIVINSTINKLESKVSLITTRCLRLFVVVYRVEML